MLERFIEHREDTGTRENRDSGKSHIVDITSATFWFLFVLGQLIRVYRWLGTEDRCDFDCYMWFGFQALGGERDYSKLECPHGMFYYPAGNLWLYAVLAKICGWSYKCTQVFGGLALVLIHVLAAKIMIKGNGIRRWVVLITLTVCSYHSFYLAIGKNTNDVYATLCAVIFIYAISIDSFWVASLFYSLSVALKMNNLFYGPALLVWYLMRLPFKRVFIQFAFMGVIQIVLPLPFLLNNPMQYIVTAFNFSRTFTWQNNHAWRFLGRELAQSEPFAKILLVATLGIMVFLMWVLFPMLKTLAANRYQNQTQKSKNVDVDKNKNMYMYITRPFTPYYALISLFVGVNWIGFACSRGVHVQFLLWVFWSIPLILTQVGISPVYVCLVTFLYDECFHSPLYDMLRTGRFDMNNSVFIGIINIVSVCAVVIRWWIVRRSHVTVQVTAAASHHQPTFTFGVRTGGSGGVGLDMEYDRHPKQQ